MKWPLIFLLLITDHAICKTTAKEETPVLLQELSSKYRKANLIEMAVEKVVKSDLLGKETKYLGKIHMAEGLFRWKNQMPEESLLIFDGSTIWNVQYPTAEFPGPLQVTKAKVSKKNRSQLLVGSLFGKEPLSKQIKIIKQSPLGHDTLFEAKPLAQDLSITAMTLIVDSEKKTLKTLSYLDDVGNLTTLNFSQIQFKTKKYKSLFKYSPPKDAQVTSI